MTRYSRSPRRGRRGSAGTKLHSVDWKHEKLVKFEKNFYRECSAVKDKSSKEIAKFLADSMITIDGKDVPRPISKFKDAGFPKSVLEVMKEMDFQVPTPIQAQGWPLALSGRNVVGIAQTGSGKTATFLLPAIVHIKAQPPIKRHDGPIALVLVTTRELAQQVEKVARQFCSNSGLKCACLYGGAPKQQQLRDLERYPEVVIATPGRLLDFLESKDTNLRRCTYLVVDEADRMLDMGFEPSLRRIMSQVRPDRQTLMWSATWPKQVRSLAKEFLNSYVQINVGSHDLHANHNIKQIVEVISESKKYYRLVDLLKEFGKAKTLVFVETKKKADELSDKLKNRRFAVAAMHGDKHQRERDAVLNDFRRSRINTLVATDVASRGLDILDIEYIVNFDYPTHAEDYVHRIGRTGRSNNKGTAYTFFTSDSPRIARQLIEVLDEAKQKVPSKLKDISRSFAFETSRRDGHRGRREVQRWRDVSSSPRKSRSRSPIRRSRSPSHGRHRYSSVSSHRRQKRSRSHSPSVKRSNHRKKHSRHHHSSRSHSRYSSSRSLTPVVSKNRRSRSSSREGSHKRNRRRSRSYSFRAHRKSNNNSHRHDRHKRKRSLSYSKECNNKSKSPSSNLNRSKLQSRSESRQDRKSVNGPRTKHKYSSHSPKNSRKERSRSHSHKRRESSPSSLQPTPLKSSKSPERSRSSSCISHISSGTSKNRSKSSNLAIDQKTKPQSHSALANGHEPHLLENNIPRSPSQEFTVQDNELPIQSEPIFQEQNNWIHVPLSSIHPSSLEGDTFCALEPEE